MLEDQDSGVTRFYENRSIFITGATGFVGKVLLEKLLRSCPGIRNIYILMREKRGKSPKQRWEELLRSSVFNWLKSEHPEAINKVVVVTGDLLLPFLGISESDITSMQENVSIVFHAAATIRFEETLKLAVDMNVVGTRKVVELCHKFQKIEALIHVSTAYSNCPRNEIEEVIYPPPLPPQEVIEMTRWLEPEVIETLTPKIIGDWPNTYTFTKALAENLLVEECGSIPVAIVRPSIVSAAWKEPYPGWIDNLNGPSGVVVASAKGLLRTFVAYEEVTADIIPVDVVVNLIITAAWHRAVYRPDKIMVFHSTSGSINKTTWAEVRECSATTISKHPSAEIFRYPNLQYRRSRLSHNIHSVFEHYLIAFFFDVMSYILLRKPQMVRLYKKIHKATDCLEYFTTREWKFHYNNIYMLNDLFSTEDRQKFFLDVKSLNWDSFWNNHFLGCRRFLLREDPATIPAAKKKLRVWYFCSQGVDVVLILGAWAFFFSKVLSLNKLWYLASAAAVKLQSIFQSVEPRDAL